jgi:hypothetical protein
MPGCPGRRASENRRPASLNRHALTGQRRLCR